MLDALVDNLPLLMIAALAPLLFSGLPVALVLAGIGLSFAFAGWLLDIFPLIALYNVPIRIFGTIGENLIYPAVPMLLFMGVALEKSGIAAELLQCLQVLLRRVPGSLAVAVTIIGIILAPSAGLIGASVATLALVALPTMLERGYAPSFASGAVAAAGTLGIMLPPGIMLFFLADLLDLQIAWMFLSTLVPGAILASLYMLYYSTAAALRPALAPPLRDIAPMRPWRLVAFALRSLFLPVLLITMVLGSIVAGWATPTQSASVGAVGAILLMVLNRTLSLPRLHEIVIATALLTSMVFFVVIGATVFSYVFRYLGGDSLIYDGLKGLGLGDWSMLAVVLGIIFVLGFFIDWIEITLITLPIFYPLLKALDFSAWVGSPSISFVWIAVLIAINLQVSFLTPPFGFALFFLKGAAPPQVTLGAIYRGIVPLVLIQLVGLLLVAAVPALATWLPLTVIGD